MAGGISRISKLLFSQSKQTSILLGTAFLVIVGVCDYETGDEVLITVFYLLPISIFAWAIGIRAGILMALMSELTETCADLVEKYLARNLYSIHTFVYVWNTLGKALFFVIFAYAISKLREFHEAQEKMIVELRDREAKLQSAYKDLEMFSSAISHDLRAPLIPIEGFSRIIMEDYDNKLDERARDLLSRIRDKAKRMAQLINDLLSFCLIREKDVRKVEINMEALALEAFEELSPMINGREVQLKVLLLPAAYGDSATIRQVFINLFSNAIKFTRNVKAATIEVGGYAEGNATIYYVKDNGLGFDMQMVDKLFGIFQIIHTEKEFEGTGIGLASIKRIIEKHGGRVWAEGESGKGATFYFSIPKEVV